MGFGSSIRAGAAFVELKSHDSGFTRGLKAAERRLERFGSLARRVGAGLLIGGGLFAPLAASAIKTASDTEESLSRFNQIFGDQTKEATAFAEELAERIGRSTIEIQDSLATLQGFFVGLGFDKSKSRAMSQELTELALDFASFNNLSDEEAISRFLSAMSGSSEVLDKFGINTKQAALQQELLALGINKSWSAVTEQEKAMARMSIIAKTMGQQGAVGDATRTAGSFANQLKRLKSSTKDTANQIGQALLPTATRVIKVINPIVKSLASWVGQNKPLVATVFAVAGAVAVVGGSIIGLGLILSIAGIALGGIITAVTFAGGAIAVAGAALSGILLPVALVIAAVGGMAAFILIKATNIGEIIDLLGDVFGGLAKNATDILGSIGRAIMGGDLELAVKIAGKGMEIAWATSLAAMKSEWFDFNGQIAKGFVTLGLVGRGLDKDEIKRSIDGDTQSSKNKLKNEIQDLVKELEKLNNQIPDAPTTAINAKKMFESFALEGFKQASTGARTSARGVFNASALSSLSSPVEKSIAQNTAQTAKNIEKLTKAVKTGGVRFA